MSDRASATRLPSCGYQGCLSCAFSMRRSERHLYNRTAKTCSLLRERKSSPKAGPSSLVSLPFSAFNVISFLDNPQYTILERVSRASNKSGNSAPTTALKRRRAQSSRPSAALTRTHRCLSLCRVHLQGIKIRPSSPRDEAITCVTKRRPMRKSERRMLREMALARIRFIPSIAS